VSLSCVYEYRYFCMSICKALVFYISTYHICLLRTPAVETFATVWENSCLSIRNICYLFASMSLTSMDAESRSSP
jgi:hypothetical protein